MEISYTKNGEGKITVSSEFWRDDLDGREVMVSVRCMAYNQAGYIHNALDGFVMQKANFRYEVIVHDDASTDGTSEIIEEYAEKYPSIIKPIFEKENLYSKKDGSLFGVVDAHLRGKYLAICEGDDYWTDPNKLQKQIDFLEANPDYSLTCHTVRTLDESTQNLSDSKFDSKFKEGETGFTFGNRENMGSWYTKTLSVVYRRSADEEFNKYNGLWKRYDFIHTYFVLKAGKGYIFNDSMGVFRYNQNSTFSNKKAIQRFNITYRSIQELYRYDNNELTKKYYYKWYVKMFYLTRGGILFKEKFEIGKFMSLFKYLPRQIAKKLLKK